MRRHLPRRKQMSLFAGTARRTLPIPAALPSTIPWNTARNPTIAPTPTPTICCLSLLVAWYRISPQTPPMTTSLVGYQGPQSACAQDGTPSLARKCITSGLATWVNGCKSSIDFHPVFVEQGAQPGSGLIALSAIMYIVICPCTYRR